eukprot:5912128-Pyramimonas_sp.AAC.1
MTSRCCHDAVHRQVIHTARRPGNPARQVVLHAGGALADAAARNQTVGAFKVTAAAKAGAAAGLANQTWALPLAARVYFSSVAALLGAPGQANCAFLGF